MSGLLLSESQSPSSSSEAVSPRFLFMSQNSWTVMRLGSCSPRYFRLVGRCRGPRVMIGQNLPPIAFAGTQQSNQALRVPRLANCDLIWTENEDLQRIQCKVENRQGVITAYTDWIHDALGQAITVTDDLGPVPDEEDEVAAPPAQRRRLSLENFGD